jgi:threonine/homoserine efflux transporter RhtA
MTMPADSLRSDQIGRAILLTLITIIVFGIQDAVSKMLVQTYSPFLITMMRYWGFAAFALFMVARQAPLRQALVSRAAGWQVLRGVLLIADIWFFAMALQTVPLGELQAIVIVYPLLVTLFAIPLLGEKVGIFRFAAVGAGFLGALVIMRPGGIPLDWGVAYALVSAIFYAIYIVITRKVSGVDSAATSLTYIAVVGLVLSSCVGVFFWGTDGMGRFRAGRGDHGDDLCGAWRDGLCAHHGAGQCLAAVQLFLAALGDHPLHRGVRALDRRDLAARGVDHRGGGPGGDVARADAQGEGGQGRGGAGPRMRAAMVP